MNIKYLISIDPGSRSCIVVGDASGRIIRAFIAKNMIFFRDWLEYAYYSITGLKGYTLGYRASEGYLVVIEDQHLDTKSGAMLNAISSLLKNTTKWECAYELLDVPLVRVPIPTWKSYCKVWGKDRDKTKIKALEYSKKYDNNILEMADAFCIYDWALNNYKNFKEIS